MLERLMRWCVPGRAVRLPADRLLEDASPHLMPYALFEARMADPERQDATIERTMGEIANGPSYRHLTYDPFTFKSRIFGPSGRIDGR